MIGVYSSIGVNKPGEVYSIKLGMSYDSHTVESEKCLNFDKSEEYCHLFFFVTLQQLTLCLIIGYASLDC